MKLMYRFAAAALCGSLLLSSSCSKRSARAANRVKEEDPYYLTEEFPLTIPVDPDKELVYQMIDNARIYKNRVVLSYSLEYRMPQDIMNRISEFWSSRESYSDEEVKEMQEIQDSYSKNGLLVYDLSGKYLYDLDFPQGSTCLAIFDAPDGKMMAAFSDLSEDWQAPTIAIYTVSDNGELTDPVTCRSENSFVQSVIPFSDGRFLFCSEEGIQLIGKDGKTIGSDTLDDRIQTIYEISGKYYAYICQIDPETLRVSNMYLSEIDTASGKLSKTKTEVRSGISPLYLCQGEDGLYSTVGNGLSSYDILNGSDPVQIFTWSEMDLNYSGVWPATLKILSKEEFNVIRTFYADAETGEFMCMDATLIHIRKAQKNPHAGKKIVELATNGAVSSCFLDYLVEYNRNTENPARIVIRDYSEDKMTALEEAGKVDSSVTDKLYLEMLSGSGPDILMNFGEYAQFEQDGILLDLNSYIDGKAPLPREEIFDNVVRAYERDGKLYQIPYCFSVSGMAGNTDYVGDRTSWDLAGFEQAGQELPEAITFIEDTSWEDLLSSMLSGSMGSFIDYEKKSCNFDNSDFRKILELTRKYGCSPQTIKENEDVDPMYMEYIMKPTDRLDEGLLAIINIDFHSLYEFGEYSGLAKGKVTFLGDPGTNSTGMSAVNAGTMAISKSSDCKDEAWDFISYIFGGEIQYKMAMTDNCFPVRKSALDQVLSAQLSTWKKNTEYYFDPLHPSQGDKITEETVNELRSVISSIHGRGSSDPTVMLIINEEAPGYFTGTRSLDDVVRNIQNRCTTIVRERG